MSSKGKVYFKDRLSGIIEKNGDSSFTFTYKDEATEVSWTLPRKEGDYTSEDLFPFFDGLIPEGWLLNLTQKNWKIPKNDRMTVMERVRDQMLDSFFEAEDLIERSFLSEAKKEEFMDLLRERSERLAKQ